MSTKSKSRTVLYNNIEKLITTGSAVATIATASMPNTTLSAPVYDEANGAIIGYVALYANATLT